MLGWFTSARNRRSSTSWLPASSATSLIEALEDHPAQVDAKVLRHVEPAHAAVPHGAHHLVALGDPLAGVQPGAEGERRPAARAPSLRGGGDPLHRPADRLLARRAEPPSFRDRGVERDVAERVAARAPGRRPPNRAGQTARRVMPVGGASSGGRPQRSQKPSSRMSPPQGTPGSSALAQLMARPRVVDRCTGPGEAWPLRRGSTACTAAPTSCDAMRRSRTPFTNWTNSGCSGFIASAYGSSEYSGLRIFVLGSQSQEAGQGCVVGEDALDIAGLQAPRDSRCARPPGRPRRGTEVRTNSEGPCRPPWRTRGGPRGPRAASRASRTGRAPAGAP